MAQKGKNVVRPPEGFRRLGSVSSAPWFNLVEGNKLLGTLENVYTRTDDRVKGKDGQPGTSKFFQICLLEPAQVREGKGEQAKVVEAEAGTVVNLNWNPKTKELEKLIPDILRGAEYQVFVHVGKKMPISRNRSMWDMMVASKMITAPTATDDDLEGDVGDEVAE